MNEFDELVDQLDACVFSGECLVDDHNRENLKSSIESWLREIERMKSLFPADIGDEGVA